VQHGAGLLNHHFRELDDGGDGDDEGDGAQVNEVKGDQQGVVDDPAGPGAQGEHEGGGRPHAEGGFQLLGNPHEGAQAKNAHQHHVIDQGGADEKENVVSDHDGVSEPGIMGGRGVGNNRVISRPFRLRNGIGSGGAGR